MTAVWLNRSIKDDVERRARIYAGEIFVYDHLRSVAEFANFTRGILEAVLAPHDPRHIHETLSPAELASMWPYGLAVLASGLAVWWPNRKGQGFGRRLGAFLIAAGSVCLGLALLAKFAIWREVELANYRMVLYALALIFMMILRPQGLLGVHEIWERGVWGGGRKK